MSNTKKIKSQILGMDGKPIIDTQIQTQTGEELTEYPFEDFDMYQAMTGQVDPSVTGLTEVLIGMSEEHGEFMGIHKRLVRGDYKTEEEQSKALNSAIKELGDFMFYASEWCTLNGVPFSTIPLMNLEKMAKRMNTSTILGTGDNREDELLDIGASPEPNLSPVELKEAVPVE